MNFFLLVVYFIGLYFVIFWLVIYFTEDSKEKKIQPLKKFPKVSVIIPAYNEEKKILVSIKSLLRLNYPKNKLEIIVVNDGSTDNTRKVVEDFIKTSKKNIILINQTNKGKGVALNKGIKVSTGEYVACLDADSRVLQDSLKKNANSI